MVFGTTTDKKEMTSTELDKFISEVKDIISVKDELRAEDVEVMLEIIEDYRKLLDNLAKRTLPGEVDSGDALLLLIKEKDQIIERQRKQLKIAREALEKLIEASNWDPIEQVMAKQEAKKVLSDLDGPKE